MTVLDETSSTSRLEAQPLYVKARNIMVDRLISGQWRPGQVLPSEFAIAAELGVSQGTVRKALDDMTAEGLVVRKQGRGTFVAEAEDNSILFRFYRLTPNDDQSSPAAQTFPESRYLSKSQNKASAKEQEIFGIGPFRKPSKPIIADGWLRRRRDGRSSGGVVSRPSTTRPRLEAAKQHTPGAYQPHSRYYDRSERN